MSAASSRVRPRALLAFAAERPGGVLAALTLGAVTVLAALAPVIASQNSFDLSSFDVLDAGLPPAWLDGSDPRFEWQEAAVDGAEAQPSEVEHETTKA